MNRFTGSLQLDFGDWTDVGAGRIAILIGPMMWHCDEPSVSVTMPTGYMTDGASVPQFLWWFLPPWGDPVTRAAILHDYLCTRLDEGNPVSGAVTREACDLQFHLALLATGIAPWRAWICWAGVRVASIVATLPFAPQETTVG